MVNFEYHKKHTCIQLTKKTVDELKNLLREGEIYDDLILRILTDSEESQETINRLSDALLKRNNTEATLAERERSETHTILDIGNNFTRLSDFMVRLFTYIQATTNSNKSRFEVSGNGMEIIITIAGEPKNKEELTNILASMDGEEVKQNGQ